MGPHLTSDRQNLALIVDGNRPLPANEVSSAKWGGTHLQYQYTWRSGHDVGGTSAMHLDGLALMAGVITVVWCGFSCVFGVLVARSIRMADSRAGVAVEHSSDEQDADEGGGRRTPPGTAATPL